MSLDLNLIFQQFKKTGFLTRVRRRRVLFVGGESKWLLFSYSWSNEFSQKEFVEKLRFPEGNNLATLILWASHFSHSVVVRRPRLPRRIDQDYLWESKDVDEMRG